MANEVIKAYVTMTGPVNGRLYSATADTLTVNDTSQKEILSIEFYGVALTTDGAWKVLQTGSGCNIRVTTSGYVEGEAITLNFSTGASRVNGLYFSYFGGELTKSTSSLPSLTATVNSSGQAIISITARTDLPITDASIRKFEFRCGVSGSTVPEALMYIEAATIGHYNFVSSGNVIAHQRTGERYINDLGFPAYRWDYKPTRGNSLVFIPPTGLQQYWNFDSADNYALYIWISEIDPTQTGDGQRHSRNPANEEYIRTIGPLRGTSVKWHNKTNFQLDVLATTGYSTLSSLINNRSEALFHIFTRDEDIFENILYQNLSVIVDET